MDEQGQVINHVYRLPQSMLIDQTYNVAGRGLTILAN